MQPPAPLPVAQQLAHALARDAQQLRELLLRQVEVDGEVVADAPAVAARQVQQVAGEALVERERGPGLQREVHQAGAAAEELDEASIQHRVSVEQGLEGLARDDEHAVDHATREITLQLRARRGSA